MYKGKTGTVDFKNLTVGDAFATGGSFDTGFGRYDGNWYQASAADKEGNEYAIFWTDVNWDVEDGSDACDWDNPDYIFDEHGNCYEAE